MKNYESEKDRKVNKLLNFIILFLGIALIIGYVKLNNTDSETNSSTASNTVSDEKDNGKNDKTKYIELDNTSWNQFKDLYKSHNKLMNGMLLYSNQEISSVDFYDFCKEMKNYFREYSGEFSYGNNDEEITYLNVLKSIAEYDQMASEQLMKYIDTGKTSKLSKAKENINLAVESISVYSSNRGLILVKAGLSDKEIKDKLDNDMKDLE